jgi:hypothetical protein
LIRQYFQSERRKSFYTNNNSRFVGTAQIVPLKNKAFAPLLLNGTFPMHNCKW